jgi:hypothetical protein
MKIACRNCGEVINLPDSEPRHTHIHFGFSKLWDNLFTETGIVLVFIVGLFVLPVIFGVFNHESEYDAIKKAIETPGIKVEITKGGDNKIQWKILKGDDPEPEKAEKKK